MASLRWSIAFTLAIVVAAPAAAADRSLAAASLTLRWSGSGDQKLVLIAKDQAFLFPAVGSADDPGTGTPGGAMLEIASAVEPAGAVLVVPSGVGKPGWRSSGGPRPTQIFANPDAAPGPGAVKTIVLKQGRILKVVANRVGLAFPGPQGTVGIRLTTGTLRNCARFDASTVRVDKPGRFKAVGSVALSDCSELVPPTTTTSTFSTTTTSTTAPSVQCPCYTSAQLAGTPLNVFDPFGGAVCQTSGDFSISSVDGCAFPRPGGPPLQFPRIGIGVFGSTLCAAFGDLDANDDGVCDAVPTPSNLTNDERIACNEILQASSLYQTLCE